MTLDDFNEAVGTRLPQDAAHTMAGFVFNALGHRPRPGDPVAIGAVRLAVERMDGMRIARLRIELGSTPPPA